MSYNSKFHINVKHVIMACVEKERFPKNLQF